MKGAAGYGVFEAATGNRVPVESSPKSPNIWIGFVEDTDSFVPVAAVTPGNNSARSRAIRVLLPNEIVCSESNTPAFECSCSVAITVSPFRFCKAKPLKIVPRSDGRKYPSEMAAWGNRGMDAATKACLLVPDCVVRA